MWEALCGDEGRWGAGGHHVGCIWPAGRAYRPRGTGGEDPGGAGPGVGPGGDPRVCGAVYMGEYREGNYDNISGCLGA